MERMIFERQRRAMPNQPTFLNRGKEYGGTSGMTNTILVGDVKYPVSRQTTRRLAERIVDLEEALRDVIESEGWDDHGDAITAAKRILRSSATEGGEKP